MKVENLKVTQRSIRHQIDIFKSFINTATYKCFDSSHKIAIIDTGDGNFWIRDGLHRCCAIYFSGRKIYPSEYVIEKFTYEQMSEPNLSVKYYTPFDLRTEVRLEDFFEYKSIVDRLQNEKEKLAFIRNNSHLYKTQKSNHHDSVEEFCKYIRNKLCSI